MILWSLTTLDGMQYISFQPLISVIFISRDIECCITFLLSIENYVTYDFYECFWWNSKCNNALYMIVCVLLLVYTLIVKCICLELNLFPSHVSFIQALSNIKKCLLWSFVWLRVMALGRMCCSRCCYPCSLVMLWFWLISWSLVS